MPCNKLTLAASLTAIFLQGAQAALDARDVETITITKYITEWVPAATSTSSFAELANNLVTSTSATSSSLMASTTTASASVATTTSANSSTSDGPLVFIHNMIVTPPPNLNYTPDIQFAQDAGADAMAVNFGGWGNDFTTWEGYLDDLYTAAAETTMKLFISFDMTSVSAASMVTDLTLKYKDSPAQLYYKDRLVISTFSDNDTFQFDWQTDVLDVVNAELTNPVLFLPGSINPQPDTLYETYSMADGVFYWPSYSADVSLQESFDAQFLEAAASNGKLLMMGVSPWFSKHLTDYNWGNNQDSSLFVDRFQRLLSTPPDFIELVTLNDFGESSYLRDPIPGYTDEFYYAGLDHSGFRDMAGLFSAAYKAGQTNVTVTTDAAFLMYRTQPWATPGSEDPIGVPTDSTEADNIYVVTFLTDVGEVTVVNGVNSTSFTAPEGMLKTAIPFVAGNVTLTVSRDSTTLVSKEGPAIVMDPTLWNGNAVCI